MGPINLRVVRQFAGLPEAGIEDLPGLVRAVVAFVAVGLEEIAPAIGEGYGPVLRVQRRRANQPFVLEMLEASSRALRVVAEVVKIAFGNDSKRANGRERAALVAVDLVDAVTVAYRSALGPARQVEMLRKDVTWVVFFVPVAIVCTAPAAETALP